MTITKREFSAQDANPTVLYAKRSGDSVTAYPVTQGMFSGGMFIPEHDTQVIDETDASNVTITYSLSGSTVAIKTISVVGSITTISMSYA